MTVHCRPAAAPAAAQTIITRADARTLAIEATLNGYPFLRELPIEPTIGNNDDNIKCRSNGWIITVWLCPTMYKRVRVWRDGRTRLLSSTQPL